MNMKQDRDLAIKFEMITRKLRESGRDLSKIPLVIEKDSQPTYLTRRIMSDLEDKGRKAVSKCRTV